jgi:predicted transcriptional regulator of viral defense system
MRDTFNLGLAVAKSAGLTRIPLPQAVEILLRREIRAPVLTDYELGKLVFSAVSRGEVDGRALRLNRREPSRADFNSVRRTLITRGVLDQDRNLPGTVVRLVSDIRSDPELALCAMDPFRYVSHLSAMAYHGLTNRLPKILFFTAPAATLWTSLAQERMQRDLGDGWDAYRASGLPLLHRHKTERLQGQSIHLTQTKAYGGGFRLAMDGLLRVSTLGRTYLDMLRRPDLCGGMSHVVEIFEQRAADQLQLIIGEVDKHGDAIDRVRAGYLLEERCGLSDPHFDQWQQLAQRGGSRVLDPDAEYAPTFSERWMLSINV